VVKEKREKDRVEKNHLVGYSTTHQMQEVNMRGTDTVGSLSFQQQLE
jgi:hypothetical protein